MRKNSSSLGGEKTVGLGRKLHPPHFLSFFFSPKANNKKSHFFCLFFIPVSILFLFLFLILTKYSINSNDAVFWTNIISLAIIRINEEGHPKFMLALKSKLWGIQIVDGLKQCYLLWEWQKNYIGCDFWRPVTHIVWTSQRRTERPPQWMWNEPFFDKCDGTIENENLNLKIFLLKIQRISINWIIKFFIILSRNKGNEINLK